MFIHCNKIKDGLTRKAINLNKVISFYKTQEAELNGQDEKGNNIWKWYPIIRFIVSDENYFDWMFESEEIRDDIFDKIIKYASSKELE